MISDKSKSVGAKDILLFCTLRNEAHRIEFFLDYYRNLGVKHFFFVDNGSDDSFQELVSSHDDVTVYYTEASYKASNFGMHWLNHLLRKHGTGHWCVTCDPDEFLVYPKSDVLDLYDLTTYLDSNHRPSFFTLMVDMYGKGSLSDSNYLPGTNPLEVNPYFDKYGYFFTENHRYNSLWCQGGVRLRTMFKDNPIAAPAINKTPLVKWKWYYSYLSSMHMAIPRRLNGGFKHGLTGAVLHFKFIAAFQEKMVEEMERGQHYGDSAEYKRYLQFLKDSQNYCDDMSIEYKGWQQLDQLGLIKANEWR
ncbi:glycosyltransferase family 2 protein [Ferrimonas marina]|uniref:glycosyltransferase family 2 protein n=1 Tax=Ferrimonas marina TaxID=299255 RepID=UPI00135649F1|nr:glycosyltransferase family 2 protein [Ferrimonas marina]